MSHWRYPGSVCLLPLYVKHSASCKPIPASPKHVPFHWLSWEAQSLGTCYCTQNKSCARGFHAKGKHLNFQGRMLPRIWDIQQVAPIFRSIRFLMAPCRSSTKQSHLEEVNQPPQDYGNVSFCRVVDKRCGGAYQHLPSKQLDCARFLLLYQEKEPHPSSVLIPDRDAPFHRAMSKQGNLCQEMGIPVIARRHIAKSMCRQFQ